MVVELDIPFRGLLAGLIIAAPVGPVNVFCIQNTLEKGWRSGLLSGLGAAMADTVYGAIAGFGISFVIHFLIGEEFWFRLIGGLLLMAVGVVYYFKPPKARRTGADVTAGHTDFVSAFLLNVSNPTTVLSFLAVLATLGLGKHRVFWESSLLVASIFCGSMAWWLTLVAAANRFRSGVSDRIMQRMNHVAGIAIGGFGLVNVVLSRGLRH
jgi:threonine/homoserine/homoserine lactone efflux protein